MTNQQVRYRVGADIGGTFTDIVLIGSDGTLATKKVSSTTDDYGRGIMTGLQELLTELGLPADVLEGVVHGSTVATNAILEGKGAATALITTEGFRDVLELRRIRIPELYNLFYQKPAPLVPRRLRFEVRERMGPRGEVRVPLDEASVVSVLDRLENAGVEALAICLLHSYANPAHEQAIAKWVSERYPEMYVTCSADILPEIREYERTSTAVINAYVGPVVGRYVSSLIQQLRSIGVRAPLRIMQSNGGVMTAESAIIRPACIIESGPAAGVIASAWAARMAGHQNVITLDMGGTTAKASLIENGTVAKTTEWEVGAGINISSQLVKGGGYAIKLPVLDISEIGAGGGSIISVDKGGLLRIGPRSAGAVPGPVCYGQGGQDPTLTDALVVLGYINPLALAGGGVPLQAELARHALEEKVAALLGKPLSEAAYGVYTIAGATMMRAVKAVSTYRGRDPRDFVLMAFGGNGPIMAAEVARELQIRQVLIPPHPGLFSAFGLLYSQIEHEFVQTYFRGEAQSEPADLNRIYSDLERQALEILAQEGYPADRVTIRRSADLRYSGQAYELNVPVRGGRVDRPEIAAMAEAFGQAHQQTYGHRAVDDPVDIINLRVIGTVEPDRSEAMRAPALPVHRNGPGALPAERMAYFGPQHGLLSTPLLHRSDLLGKTVPGPLIIEEYDSTCIVPPGCSASLDPWGNIVVDVGE